MQWFLAAAVCRLCMVCTADKPAAHLHLMTGPDTAAAHLLLMADQGFRMYLYLKKVTHSSANHAHACQQTQTVLYRTVQYSSHGLCFSHC